MPTGTYFGRPASVDYLLLTTYYLLLTTDYFGRPASVDDPDPETRAASRAAPRGRVDTPNP